MRSVDIRLRHSILWLVFVLCLILVFNPFAMTNGVDNIESQCGKSPADIPKTSRTFPQSRAPWLWPFDRCSIWNMPIGANAKYSTRSKD